MFPTRASGILLHPTCFPSRYGIGDLGREAYRFIDFLVESDQRWWQILPLGPTGVGNSPYFSYSSRAGNPNLISPDLLREDGLLSDEDLTNIPDFHPDHIEFDRVLPIKARLLQTAFANFKERASLSLREEFQEFCNCYQQWLGNYTLFMSLKESFMGKSWYEWPIELRQREPQAITQAEQLLQEKIYNHQFLQFCFFRQWQALKRYANERKITIFGDIPIYVAHDSADVWANPEIFCLDLETGQPTLKAGVPPDYFSATGQLWGNPVFNW